MSSFNHYDGDSGRDDYDVWPSRGYFEKYGASDWSLQKSISSPDTQTHNSDSSVLSPTTIPVNNSPPGNNSSPGNNSPSLFQRNRTLIAFIAGVCFLGFLHYYSSCSFC